MRKLAVLLIACVAVAPVALAVGWDEMTISINVTPKMLVLSSGAKWVHIHSDMPLGLVDGSSLVVTVEGCYVDGFTVFADANGCMVIRAARASVDPYIAPGTATFTVTGATTEGVAFIGTDTIRVKR